MRIRLINWLLKHLLCTVDPSKIFTILKKGGHIIGYKLGDNVLTDAEIGNLQEEIKFLKETVIWKIFQNTLADQAKQVMFEKSKDFEDMRSGKMILYALDIQKNIVDAIEKA